MSWRGVGSVSWVDPGAVEFQDFTGYDDTDNDTLTVFELREVLKSFKNKLNGGKALDIMAFDSCYSLMMEVLYELKDGAEVIVGSPNTVPGMGLSYDGFARWLVRHPEANAEQLADVMVETFIKAAQTLDSAQIMGAWRLNQAEEIVSSLSRLSLELIRAKRAGVKLSFQNQTRYNDRYWDLKRFARSILDGNSGVTPAPNLEAIVEAAQAVEAARNAALITLWYKGSFAEAKAGGMAMYWPEGKEYKQFHKFYKALGSSQEGFWDEFLDARELGVLSDR